MQPINKGVNMLTAKEAFFISKKSTWHEALSFLINSAAAQNAYSIEINHNPWGSSLIYSRICGHFVKIEELITELNKNGYLIEFKKKGWGLNKRHYLEISWYTATWDFLHEEQEIEKC